MTFTYWPVEQLKKYKRQWRIDLIEKDNPTWRDLYAELAEEISRDDRDVPPEVDRI